MLFLLYISFSLLSLLWYLSAHLNHYSICNAAVTYIDSSAVQALKDLHQEYKSRDIQVDYPSFVKSHGGWLITMGYEVFWMTIFISIVLSSFCVQIAISNPNREVLMTLSKSDVVELIGKEWYFVRVHDAVQVCLQHVQNLKETSKPIDQPPDEKSSFFRNISKRRGEDSSITDIESGSIVAYDSTNKDPQLEPLLSRKP